MEKQKRPHSNCEAKRSPVHFSAFQKQLLQALSPPMSSADAGKLPSPSGNRVQQIEQEFLSQLFDSLSTLFKRARYIKKAMVHFHSCPSTAACLCGVNGFAGSPFHRKGWNVLTQKPSGSRHTNTCRVTQWRGSYELIVLPHARQSIATAPSNALQIRVLLVWLSRTPADSPKIAMTFPHLFTLSPLFQDSSYFITYVSLELTVILRQL